MSGTDDLVEADEGLARVVQACAFDVLRRELDPRRTLFAQGVSSLDVVRFANRLEAALQRPVELRLLIDAEDLGALVAALAGSDQVDRDRPSHGTTVAHHGPDPFRPRAGSGRPLTPSEERMWFLHVLAPESTAYHVLESFWSEAPLDVPRLVTAWHDAVRRHPILRSAFDDAGGRPTATVTDATPDLEFRSFEDAAEAVAWLRRELTRPFDLRNGRPCRLRVASCTETTLVGVGAHHIAVDQWALSLVLADLAAAYEGRRPSDRPEVDDDGALHAATWRSIDPIIRERQLDHWTSELAGAPDLQLPTDHPRSARAGSTGGTCATRLGTLEHRVRALAAQLDTTPFTIYLAAFFVLLSRHQDDQDLVVGVPVSGRNVLEAEHLVGNFVNTVSIRSRISDDLRFCDLVGCVRKATIDALAHQDVSFAEVSARLGRTGAAAPLVRVMFNLADYPRPLPIFDGVGVRGDVLDRGGSQFDLSLGIDIWSTHTAQLDFDGHLFERPTAEAMLERYMAMLERLVETPERPIADVPSLSSHELDRLRASWHRHDRPLPAETVVDMVRRAARRHPDDVAVVAGTTSWTYADLQTRVDALRRILICRGIQHGDLVGVHLSRSADMIATTLAVMSCGAAYVPLDPRFPTDRLAFMASDADLRCIVTEATLEPIAPDLPVLRLDLVAHADEIGEAAGEDEFPPDDGRSGAPSQDDLAYVIYTSGSTGRPKGVAIGHRALANFLRSMAARPGCTASDVVLAVTTLSFDIAALEIFLPLTVGGRVVVADGDTARTPAALATTLEHHGVTIAQGTPTMWRMMVDGGWAGLPGLRILCGGEALARDLADALLERGAELWNMYGPTETTIWSAACRVRPGTGPVTVDEPVDNTAWYVLDAKGRLAPSGVPGELWISGAGLAEGYLGRPELTADRFRPDPFSGRWSRMYGTGDVVSRTSTGALRFHGRTDHQVKIRGHRIELGEIEAAIRETVDISDVVAVALDLGGGDHRLAAYVAAGGRTLDPLELRTALAERLPAYAIPSYVELLDALPTTPNGKVDRAALPRPRTGVSAAIGDPRRSLTQTERAMASLWMDVLGVETVGPDDDFFDLGGHSLLAVRLFSRMRTEFGVDLPLTALFEGRTVGRLARLIDAASSDANVTVGGRSSEFTSLITLRADGSRTPLFYVAPFQITALSFDTLSRMLGDDQPFHVFQPQGLEQDDVCHTSVEEMATHYIREMRQVQPRGPYLVGGHCAGSWPAFEMVRQLRASGDDVIALVAVDVEPPGIDRPRRQTLSIIVGRLRYYLRERRLCSAVRWKLRLAWQHHATRRLPAAQQRRMAQVRSQHRLAHQGYAGGRIDVPVLLVRSEESAGFPDRDWHLRWHEVTDEPTEVVIVPGAHSALIEPESCEHLAAAVRRLSGGPGGPSR